MKARRIVIYLILLAISLNSLTACAVKKFEATVRDISDSVCEESSEEQIPSEQTEAVSEKESTTEYINNHKRFEDKLTCINNQNLYRMDIDFGINESLITYAEIDECNEKILFSFYVESETGDFFALYLVDEKTGEIINKREFNNSEILLPYGPLFKHDNQFIVTPYHIDIISNKIYMCGTSEVMNENDIITCGILLILDENLNILEKYDLSKESAFLCADVSITSDGGKLFFVYDHNIIEIWDISNNEKRNIKLQMFKRIASLHSAGNEGVYIYGMDENGNFIWCFYDICENVVKPIWDDDGEKIESIKKSFSALNGAYLVQYEDIERNVRDIGYYYGDEKKGLVIRENYYGVDTDLSKMLGLSFDTEIDMMKLNLYDLKSGERIYEEYYSYLIREDKDSVFKNPKFPYILTVLDNSDYAMIMTKDTEDNLIIICWDIGREEVKFNYDITVDGKKSTTEALIAEIEEKYPISISIDGSMLDMVAYDYRVVENQRLIQNSLKILDAELTKYSNVVISNMTSYFGKNLKIEFIESFDTNGGCYLRDEFIIFIDITSFTVNEGFHHELWHAICNYATEMEDGYYYTQLRCKIKDEDNNNLFDDLNNDGYINWSEINGKGVAYRDNRHYDESFNYDDLKNSGINAHFLIWYNESNAAEDWAATMEYAFYDDLEYQLMYNWSDVVSNKLYFINEVAKSTFDYDIPWEKNLWKNMLMAEEKEKYAYRNRYTTGYNYEWYRLHNDELNWYFDKKKCGKDEAERR